MCLYMGGLIYGREGAYIYGCHLMLTYLSNSKSKALCTEGPIFREGPILGWAYIRRFPVFLLCFIVAIKQPQNLFIYRLYKKGHPTLACYNVFNLNTVEPVLLNGHFSNFTNVSASNRCLLDRGYNNSV